MNDDALKLEELRDTILSRPDVILEDDDIMRALIAKNDHARGENIVDLRGIAMERLENRLDLLEDTHRSVIAAAYDNVAGTNQIHRAVLALLEPNDFEGFLATLDGSAAAILRVDHIRLVLESAAHAQGAVALHRLARVVRIVEPGFIDSYLAGGRGSVPAIRQVTLRQAMPGSPALYHGISGKVASEALLRLSFGEGTLPGMLAFGSEDPHQFRPNQATDLLAFFAGVFERQMRRWLS